MDKPIVFKQVSYTYNDQSPFAVGALHDVNLTIPQGKVTAIIGHTGSGKSTLIQHLNVLVRPSQGQVQIDEEVVTAQSKHTSLKALRKKVGVVFQFPEAQLFAETVIEDVMFGPQNFGASPEEARQIAQVQLERVGVGPDLYERSPFDLSGGQMRRVAIAGVLALEPQVLVLDEPTAGLDPLGHHQMMTMFSQLQKENNLTMIMVTHQMDDVGEYADYVVVMEQGTVVKTGTPQEIFADPQWLSQRQLGLPKAMAFLEKVHQRISDLPKLTPAPISVDQVADYLVMAKQEQGQKSATRPVTEEAIQHG
ncbi:energy-coupling factor transporter ATPase [Vaginisenegalia massiliensis]|uniref:energy-coupling factor transporter ATPase n=1 Tax=Vaginisenegalia massiliensis TaxID=2058294 RepID=UPI000F538668|nr:energy-coupling factor transporter ATPase [Vaginisenegalia massiliensis]